MEDINRNTSILDLSNTRKDKSSYSFSINKVKSSFKNEDIICWASIISFVQDGNLDYPASQEKAIIHQQSCYLRPDDEFLDQNPGVNQCNCCGRKIQRIRANYWKDDLYELLVPKEGLVWPLYFTLLKTHFFLLFSGMCLMGVYFMYYSYELCSSQEITIIDESDDNPCVKEYVYSYFFVPQDYFLANMLYYKEKYYKIYLYLATIVYTMIMLTPFIHEIIMRAMQIKYWQYDPWNMIKFDRLALYVKHLPHKMSAEEIQESIFKVIYKKNPNSRYLELFSQDVQAIDELVYIYDTHQLVELNKKREQIFLDLLVQTNKFFKIVEDLELQDYRLSYQENPQIKPLISYFKIQIQELMILTKQITAYMEQGLPFTKKIILKLRTEEQANAVYYYFKNDIFSQFYLKAQVLWEARDEIKEEKQREVDLKDKLKDSVSGTSIAISMSYNIQDLAKKFQKSHNIPILFNNERTDIIESNILNISQLLEKKNQFEPQSFLKSDNELDFKNDSISMEASQRLKLIKENEAKEFEEEDKKALSIERGFREDDILWENIGMHTLRGFLLRIFSLLVSIIASVICMGIFQYLFFWSKTESFSIYQQKKQPSLLVNITLNFIPLVIVFLSVLASIIVQITTKKARRSTYTQQEMNIINFLSFTQLLLVLSTPYLLVLSFWSGLSEAISIQTLILLGRIRIVFKGLAHVFHFRSCGYYFRKKKILKNFDGKNYFQKQLNQLLTPGYFPIRSRLLYAFFVLSTGFLMLFLAPYLVIFCLIFQLFFYYFDKYTLFRVFTVDKQFNFKLMRYLVTAYQIIMTPIYSYVFYCVFRMRSIVIESKSYNIVEVQYLGIYGLSLGLFSWITFIFFREKIGDFFVFKLLRIPKPRKNIQWLHEKSYFDSYQDYYKSKIDLILYFSFKDQGIDELSDKLVCIFQSLQQEKRERK